MKSLAYITLLFALSASAALAVEPCPNDYPAYPEGMAAPAAAAADEDREKARAAIQAGLDPVEVVPAAAAGPAYTEHPYITGGKFGKPGCE